MVAYAGDLLNINGQTIPGLKEYKVGYNKLWKDSERNMNGEIRATLIGVFPKLELTFADGLNTDQIGTICSLLNQAYFTVTYFDPKTNGTKSAMYYAGDYTVEILDRRRGIYKSFNVSLVPVGKEEGA